MNAFWGALIGLGVMLLFGFLWFYEWFMKNRIGIAIACVTLSAAGATLCAISGIVLEELDSHGEFNVTKISVQHNTYRYDYIARRRRIYIRA